MLLLTRVPLVTLAGASGWGGCRVRIAAANVDTSFCG